MTCDSTCELVQFKVTEARFLQIQPRPRADAPQDLEQTLLELVKGTLESEHHTCPGGCDCVTGDPVEVSSREQIKKVTQGDYTAWYQVTVVKYRTPGECMPATDEAPP